MAERNLSALISAFRYLTKAIYTFSSGTSHTVTNNQIDASSIILIEHITVPAGRWGIAVSAGSFTITSSDSESSATFKYIII